MAYKEYNGRWMQIWLQIVAWREQHISEKSFLVILSLIIGLLGGFAGLLLKLLIRLIATPLTAGMNDQSENYMLLVYPVIGIIIVSLFVKYIIRDNISHGVTKVLYAISQKKSRLKKKNMYASLIASSITIGFGGSVGAEGPIVFTGAAIGSNIGQAFRMSPRVLMMLIGCGSASGLAAVFHAPIAGMLFALEVLMIDLTGVTVMPLLLSSITGATVAYVMEGYYPEFIFYQTETFITSKIPYVILLGILCGFVSLYFIRVVNMMEKMFGRIKSSWLKIIVGGSIVAALVFLFPPLYGEGYSAINTLLEGNTSTIVEKTFFYIDRNSVWFVALYIMLVVFFKAFATSCTNGAGGVGGTFAPALFTGALFGFAYAFILNNMDIGIAISNKNFALMGMAGLLSGVMHAPLLGIFLTAELTGGFDLFLPLLIVSIISFGTIRIFEPYSLYAMRLARRGELLTHQKDRAVLTLLKTDSVIEKDFKTVNPNMTLKQMVHIISESNRNLFPVVDEKNKFLGVVLLDDIRNIMFRPDLYNKMHVRKFMTMPSARIDIGESMDKVMEKFDDTNAWNLPVVDGDKYVGFVSKSKIFNSYRRVLKHYSDE